MTFTEKDKLKAMAIVSVFETSRPFGDYAACVVLNDSAGVSYGINQFTHRSGSLLDVVNTYIAGGGQVAREALTAALPLLKRTSASAINKLAADEQFKKALRGAAVTREMKTAQREVAFEKYLRPALEICASIGFVLPLSLAVVYDSITHGSWERIAARVTASAVEKTWITEYVRKRHIWLTGIARLKATNYRTRFFLEQIADGNWSLNLPFSVHGVKLTHAMFPVEEEEKRRKGEEETSETNTVSMVGQAGNVVAAAVEKFDRVDNVVNGFVRRRDAAKSMWTTIVGTIAQVAWAVFGFLVGLPKEVWIVVALIAGALMILYLYRQIVLGKLREMRSGNLKSEI